MFPMPCYCYCTQKAEILENGNDKEIKALDVYSTQLSLPDFSISRKVEGSQKEDPS